MYAAEAVVAEDCLVPGPCAYTASNSAQVEAWHWACTQVKICLSLPCLTVMGCAQIRSLDQAMLQHLSTAIAGNKRCGMVYASCAVIV